MSTWMPIESAPLDGTDVLLHYEGRAPVVAAWFRDGWAPMDLGGNHISCGVPTHWMPLPNGPGDDLSAITAKDTLLELHRELLPRAYQRDNPFALLKQGEMQRLCDVLIDGALAIERLRQQVMALQNAGNSPTQS